MDPPEFVLSSFAVLYPVASKLLSRVLHILFYEDVKLLHASEGRSKPAVGSRRRRLGKVPGRRVPVRAHPWPQALQTRRSLLDDARDGFSFVMTEMELSSGKPSFAWDKLEDA